MQELTQRDIEKIRNSKENFEIKYDNLLDKCKINDFRNRINNACSILEVYKKDGEASLKAALKIFEKYEKVDVYNDDYTFKAKLDEKIKEIEIKGQNIVNSHNESLKLILNSMPSIDSANKTKISEEISKIENVDLNSKKSDDYKDNNSLLSIKYNNDKIIHIGVIEDNNSEVIVFKNLEEIEPNAIRNCNNLKLIVINKGIKKININAFRHVDSKTTIAFLDSETKIKNLVSNDSFLNKSNIIYDYIFDESKLKIEKQEKINVETNNKAINENLEVKEEKENDKIETSNLNLDSTLTLNEFNEMNNSLAENEDVLELNGNENLASNEENKEVIENNENFDLAIKENFINDNEFIDKSENLENVNVENSFQHNESNFNTKDETNFEDNLNVNLGIEIKVDSKDDLIVYNEILEKRKEVLRNRNYWQYSEYLFNALELAFKMNKIDESLDLIFGLLYLNSSGYKMCSGRQDLKIQKISEMYYHPKLELKYLNNIIQKYNYDDEYLSNKYKNSIYVQELSSKIKYPYYSIDNSIKLMFLALKNPEIPFYMENSNIERIN